MKKEIVLLYSAGAFVRVEVMTQLGRQVEIHVEGKCLFDYTDILLDTEEFFIVKAEQVSGPQLERSTTGSLRAVHKLIEESK